MSPNVTPFGRGFNTPARRELPYVLIADVNEQRIHACIDAIKPHRHGVLVAANAHEGAGILDRFGAPVLLFTDVLLPPDGGFALIEAVRRTETARTGIVAWATARELREFAICRLAGLGVRVLTGSAPPPVIHSLVTRLLNGASDAAPPTAGSSLDGAAAATEELFEWLQVRAREIAGTPGIAVYLRDDTGNAFRSSGSWAPDEPIPQSLEYLPHALNRVIETREPFVVLDVGGDRVAHGIEERGFGGLRGLVAVPVFGSDHLNVTGMICAFDVKPLALEPRQIEALAALGRSAATPSGGDPAVNRFGGRRGRQTAMRFEDAGQVRDVTKVAVLDRESGSAAVARELARVRREQYPLSVVLFDVNAQRAGRDEASPSDAPGTADGPNPVDALSTTLMSVVRGSDLAIRWGGHELLLVLPGIHSPEARRVADRVRQAAHADAGEMLSVVEGVAELGSDTWESMLERAGADLRQR